MSDASDPFAVERFVEAQDARGSFDAAVAELTAGVKQSHWMWFIFPQIEGLGSSATARRFALHSLVDAVAYLNHPILGSRLRTVTQLVAGITGRTAEDVFGSIDAMKLRSSMTLFHRAAPDDPLFTSVLERFYGGVPDARTDELLESSGT